MQITVVLLIILKYCVKLEGIIEDKEIVIFRYLKSSSSEGIPMNQNPMSAMKCFSIHTATKIECAEYSCKIIAVRNNRWPSAIFCACQDNDRANYCMQEHYGRI